jgi:GNAT superfamily N-acetyltransferase
MPKNKDAKYSFDACRIAKALTDQEWNAIRSLRNTNFFKSKEDPYTWTFSHKDHVHFVFYKDAEIIGYAHLQLWPKLRAALRIIVIDEKLRNRGYGSQFLKLCEEWLREHGYKTLHIQASKKAYRFYQRHGYEKMAFDDPEDHGSDPNDIEIGKYLSKTLKKEKYE